MKDPRLSTGTKEPSEPTDQTLGSTPTEVNDAITFLRMFRPGGPWVLSAIVPGGRISTSTFGLDTEERLREWIAARDGHENLYFQVNSSGRLTKKATKADITSAEWLHVDVDPDQGGDFEGQRERILDRLRAFQPRPQVIVDSGGGYQAFWRIASTDDLDDVEAVNRWLARELGGDHCHNIDRIMRLPFTTNVPNKKKRQAGRVPTLARVVRFEDGQTDPAPLGRVHEEEPQPVAVSTETTAFTEAAAREIVSLLNANAQERILHPERHQRDGSRNENAFSVLQSLVAQEMEDEAILGIVTHPSLPVSDYFLRDKNGRARPSDFAARQLAKAKGRVEQRGARWVQVSKAGTPMRSYENAREGLHHLGLDIWHDVFAGRDMVEGMAIQDFAGVVTDAALVVLRDMVRERFGFDPGKEHLRDAFASLAVANRRDPVVEQLDRLVWDGHQRLGTWLCQVYGAPDTPYVREVGRLMLRAMCRRAREPGVKYDHMVILEGRQGVGKSLSLAILAGDRFSDAGIFAATGDRDRGELLQGNWINEVAELEGLSKRDVTEVKRFITQTHDEYRAAYAHNKERRARRGILVGTTNDQNWNRDPTGARRFLPIHCGEVDLDWLRANRDQLLAEADGFAGPLILPREVWAQAEAEQAQRQAAHAWDDYLADMVPEARFGGWERVSSKHLIERVLGLNASTVANANTTKMLAERMRLLGWEGPQVIVLKEGRRARGYRRQTDQPDLLDEPPF